MPLVPARPPGRPGRLAGVADAATRRRLLRSILASRPRLESVVAGSYWHPNGFLKVVLVGASGGAQVRLHVWPDAAESGDIHDHAWGYASVVVSGAVQEVVYREAPPGEGRRLWRHPYGLVAPGRFRLHAPVEVDLAEGERRVVRAGGRSGGPAHHIHRFWAAEAPAVTFLHVAAATRGVSHVYRAHPTAAGSVVPRQARPAEVVSWVEHALAAP